MAQQIEQAAIDASISTLSDVQVLTLYNYCVRNDVDRSDALEARVNTILDSDRVVGYDDKGKELNAVSYLDELDAAYNTKEYNELLNATQKTINEVASKEQDNINWYRDNYAAAIAEYNENAEIIKKNLGVDLNFEAGTSYTSAWSDKISEYNELFKKYNTADGKGSTLDAESLSAISRMKEITDELEAHSFIGNDKLLQQTGAIDENSVSAYYGSGTGGTANDQQGIGQSDIGTGIGAGGSGNGTGSGVGDDDGDGGTVEAKKGGYNSNG